MKPDVIKKSSFLCCVLGKRIGHIDELVKSGSDHNASDTVLKDIHINHSHLTQ